MRFSARQILPVLILAVALAAGLHGCSDDGGTAGGGVDGQVHDRAWNNPAQRGQLTFHGRAVVSEGTGGCTVCHGGELGGSGDIPGCRECHFSAGGGRVPPGETWTHGSSHADLLEFGETCNACHAAYRSSGLPPANCHDCHVGAAHPLGRDWLDRGSATFHGDAAQADLDSCRQCHGQDLQGGVAQVGCEACHFGPGGARAPADSSWQHGTVPHGQFADVTDVCNSCHTATREFGSGPSSCHDCHVSANHPLGQPWLDPAAATFHGDAAQSGLEACRSCHGAELDGGSSGVSCNTCHFGPGGGRVPAASTWTHGTVPHEQLEEFVAVCNACHELNRTFGHGPSACHDCHAGATHPLGQAWLDKDNPGWHGAVAQADPTPCAACHGNDFQGGISGVNCSECHFGPNGSKAPAGVQWTHGTVPHDQQALVDAIAVCAACHEVSRRYGNGPTACHDCHVGATHPLGQAWLDVDSSSFHGVTAQGNLDSCRVCHGSELDGGSAGVSCDRCHFGPLGSKVPQGVSWTHGTIPHGSLTPHIAVCNSCHEVSRLYDNGPASCHDCHVSATHPLGQAWLDRDATGFHGDAAAQNLVSCAPCHGSDYRGGSSGVSCYQCHFGPAGGKVPSGVTWTHGAIPHDQLYPYGAVCTSCHSVNQLYGNPPSPCHDCHAQATHPLDQAWLDPNSAGYHGIAASQDLDSCAPCHGGDFQGGLSGVSCYQCHFGPNGTKVPAGVTWTHGNVPHDALAPYVAVCNTCHNLERSYGNPPAACHDCHAGATHPVGQPWLDPTVTGFHGDAAAQDVDSCASCHGADYQGGISGVSCSECHFGPTGTKVPGGETWTHGTIPHETLAPYIATCNACHDLLRGFGVGPASCHDCHAGATHPLGESWVSPASSTFHGDAAAADLDSCRSCHGSDLAGGISGVSCSDCHFGPGGSRVPDGVTWTHGSVPHDTLTPYIATCNTCHDLLRSYGIGPASCHDCHVGATHPVGESWVSPASSTFHGDAAVADLDGCRSCHGSDLAGGSSGVSCSDCHFGPTGSRVPAGVVWAHGSIPHDALAPYIATCNVCHDLLRSYGIGPASCHDCHGSGTAHITGAEWLLPSNHAQASITDRTACLACHDMATGGSGIQPACRVCHTVADPPLAIGSCTSCHSRPPSTGQHGDHSGADCARCHQGFGTASLQHYYPVPAPPADIQFSFTDPADDLTATFDSGGNLLRCSGTCHIDSDSQNHGNFSW